MACGMLAFNRAGVPVERYVAYEVDDAAIATASHNFQSIEQRGDVFVGGFAEFCGFDYLIGGSPCTYWSVAQKKGREVEASGLGWELFQQYVRALRQASPEFFIYENNKSMSRAIRQSISDAFGFEPVYINSALVSVQTRHRLYWVGRRNTDGTYSKVEVPQPADRHLYLDEVLTSEDFAPYKGWSAFVREKADLNEHYDSTYRVGVTGKSGGQAVRVYDLKGKTVAIQSQAGGGGARTGLYMVDGAVKALSKSGVAKCQTIPAEYEFPVSDNKAISLMGNGWTVDVIAHILAHTERARQATR